MIFSSWEKREVKVWRRQSCIRFVLSGASDVPPKTAYKAAARGHLMFLRSIKVVWFVLLSESLNVSHLPLICITSLPRIRLIVHYIYGKYSSVMYVNPKHEGTHKPLALCLSLLTSIGTFSVPQAGYSRDRPMLIRFTNNRATGTTTSSLISLTLRYFATRWPIEWIIGLLSTWKIFWNPSTRTVLWT